MRETERILTEAETITDITLADQVQLASDHVAHCLEALQQETLMAAIGSDCAQSAARCLALLYPLKRPASTLPGPAQLSEIPIRKSVGPAPGGDDRRKSPRAVLQTEIGFESDSNFYVGFSEDVSEGGMFIATYNLREVGEHVELTFTLPDGKVVNAKGVVRWIRVHSEDSDGHPGFGVQFESLEGEDKSAVAAFAQARSPLFFDD
jgi:uncharacterized protein (TIGR02266 family)